MATKFQTTRLSGYFDCRIFKNGVAKDQRPMKQDGDTITFGVTFAEYPQQFADNGGEEFIREYEVNGDKRWAVNVKIGRICQFFDRKGIKVARPSNAELDGKRWDAVMKVSVLHGDASKLQPRGFWADGIQIRPAHEMTFASMDDDDVPQVTEPKPVVMEKPTAQAEPNPVREAPIINEAFDSDDLPF